MSWSLTTPYWPGPTASDVARAKDAAWSYQEQYLWVSEPPLRLVSGDNGSLRASQLVPRGIPLGVGSGGRGGGAGDSEGPQAGHSGGSRHT